MFRRLNVHPSNWDFRLGHSWQAGRVWNLLTLQDDAGLAHCAFIDIYRKRETLITTKYFGPKCLRILNKILRRRGFPSLSQAKRIVKAYDVFLHQN